VECGSDFDIQYDHVIPVARGGSNEVDNLQILCATCNRKKGTSL
jgi:5-methylcytosine-specific restriction endonuclease McrA